MKNISISFGDKQFKDNFHNESKNHKTQMRVSKSDCLSKNHKNSSQIYELCQD